MSYASVLAENASPLEDQPKPNANLLEGQGNHYSTQPHFEHKQDDEGDTKEPEHYDHSEANNPDPKKGTEKKRKRVVHDHPEKKFQAISLMNILALVGTALIASKYWRQPSWDKRVVSGFVVGFGVLFGSQGYLGKSFYNLVRKRE